MSDFTSMESTEEDRPRFAVIRLKPESNLLGLFQLLLCNGFGEVAFVKSLSDANFGGENCKESTSRQEECGQENPFFGNPSKNSMDISQSIFFDQRSDSHLRSSHQVAPFQFGQCSQNSRSSMSPLPLSTFSCPLPLPVDRSMNTAESKVGSTKSIGQAKPGSQSSKNLAPTSTPSSKVKLTPNVSTPTNSPIISTQPILQRSSTKESHSVFVSCHLCNSKIMATRFSNLTNHVRRHAPCKQFQCCYCDYAHNEIAKVRLHMANNHGDKKSRPLNNINLEMQDTWRRLMRECFPERSKKQKPPKPVPQQPTATAIVADGSRVSKNSVPVIFRDNDIKDSSLRLESMAKAKSSKSSGRSFGNSGSTMHLDDGQRFARCDQCYVYVNINMKESHVRSCHLENTPSAAFVCSLCGLENVDCKEVETHIRLEHGEQSEAQVVNADLAAYVDQMINEYFPIHGLEYTSNFDSNDFDQKPNLIGTLDRGHSSRVVGVQSGHLSKNASKAKKRCGVCHRLVNKSDLMKHVHQHLGKTFLQFQCPICTKYQTSAVARIRRHLDDKHGFVVTDAIPGKKSHSQISPGQQNFAIAQAMKRCFGSPKARRQPLSIVKNYARKFSKFEQR